MMRDRIDDRRVGFLGEDADDLHAYRLRRRSGRRCRAALRRSRPGPAPRARSPPAPAAGDGIPNAELFSAALPYLPAGTAFGSPIASLPLPSSAPARIPAATASLTLAVLRRDEHERLPSRFERVSGLMRLFPATLSIQSRSAEMKMSAGAPARSAWRAPSLRHKRSRSLAGIGFPVGGDLVERILQARRCEHQRTGVGGAGINGKESETDSRGGQQPNEAASGECVLHGSRSPGKSIRASRAWWSPRPRP